MDNMEPELQKALVEIVTLLKDGSLYAANAARGELPLLVREYLQWGMFANAAYLVLFSVLAVLALRAGKFCRQFQYKPFGHGLTSPSEDIGKFFGNVGARLVATLCAIFAFDALLQVFQILVAPRVYLLERLSSLVK